MSVDPAHLQRELERLKSRLTALEEWVTLYGPKGLGPSPHHPGMASWDTPYRPPVDHHPV